MCKLKRLMIIFYAMIAWVLITGCDQEAAQEAPLQMPFKENTWVRKETVTKSKDDFFSSTGKQIESLPVDASLAKQLKTISTPGASNEKDCIAQAAALDQRRTEVQKRGGLWHSFEKVAETKKYSDYGMQLDSQMNRLVFSLKYLCRAAKGMPLDGWARNIVAQVEENGKEKMREYNIEMGSAPADVDTWIAFAEMAIESKKRDISYEKIGESISRAGNMVALYEKLSLEKVDESSLQPFYKKASTLLSVINDSLKSDPNIALSVKEENFLAITDLEGEL